MALYGKDLEESMNEKYFANRVSAGNRKYLSKLKTIRERQQNKLAKDHPNANFKWKYYLYDPKKVSKAMIDLQKIGVDGSQIEPHMEGIPHVKG